MIPSEATVEVIAPATAPAPLMAAASEAIDPIFLTPTVRVEKPGPRLQINTARGFEWTHVRFPVRHLADEFDGLRMLHISDIHTRGGWDPAYEDLIERVAKNPPDMILYTGDFVDNRHDHRAGLPTVQKLLNRLKARLGSFAILGNHDGDLIAPSLAGMNVTLIDHSHLCLHSGSATLELIGLTGVDRNDLDPAFMRGLGTRPPGALRIVLAHYPDVILRSALLKPDLYLCGHTHGGQICLPGRIPLIRHDSLPRKYCSGIHQAYGTWMITSRGLGFSSHIRFRAFCPAEVIEIELVKSASGLAV